jgi:hypothetical protein
MARIGDIDEIVEIEPIKVPEQEPVEEPAPKEPVKV